MTDDELEREITIATDFLADANKRCMEAEWHQKYWANRLTALINQRSPEQVEK